MAALAGVEVGSCLEEEEEEEEEEGRGRRGEGGGDAAGRVDVDAAVPADKTSACVTHAAQTIGNSPPEIAARTSPFSRRPLNNINKKYQKGASKTQWRKEQGIEATFGPLPLIESGLTWGFSCSSRRT
jgi:hypothetical protein